MSRTLALAFLASLALPAAADTALPASVVPEVQAGAPAAPQAAPALPEAARRAEVAPVEGKPLAPALKSPRSSAEPEPEDEPALLAAPVPVEAKTFSKLLDHVRKYCAPDEETGLCCLTGQAPLRKGAPTRTACLEIEVPEQDGDVKDLVYREAFTGLTIISAEAKGRPQALESTTLEMGMGGSVAQASQETEGGDGVKSRREAMKPEEARRLFEAAAKDLLTITPQVKI